MRVMFIGASMLLIAGLLTWALLTDTSSTPEPTPSNIQEAVADEVGTASIGRGCKPKGAGRWRCQQWDPGMSGDSRAYRVRLDEELCFTGRIIGSPQTSEGPMPKNISGCL